MYENIGLLELRGPLAPLFYIGLWEAFFNLFVTGGRIYQAPHVPGQKNILLWPGHILPHYIYGEQYLQYLQVEQWDWLVPLSFFNQAHLSLLSTWLTH